ncbi:MAG: diguanylate cyclase (GGDEF)-like protein [Phenylobacterium sp.]|jgi:diguanylate cyclase (GGDEF)-like protein
MKRQINNRWAGSGLAHQMGLVVILLCLVFRVSADDNDDKGMVSLPLAKQLVEEAKALEKVEVKAAITMMLSRETEVNKVSSAAELAHFYSKLAELSATLGQAAKIKQYAEQGLALYRDESDPIVADLYYHLGWYAQIKANYGAAQQYFNQGLLIAAKTDDQLMLGRGKLNIASLYTDQDNYQLGLKHMKEAYEIALQLKNDDLLWEILNEMGLLYSYIGDAKQALAIFLQAVEAAEATNIRELKIITLYNIAVLYIEEEDPKNANVYFNQMLIESKASGIRSDQYMAYKGFAMSSRLAKQPERAMAYMLKAEELFDSIEGVFMRVEHHSVKAEIFSSLDLPNKALEQLSIAEKLMPKEQLNNNNRAGLRILRLKSQFYSELGQYRRAYELSREYNQGYEQWRSQEKDKTVGRLSVAFDVERNEARNAILEKENEIKALQLKQAKNEQQIQTFFLVALALLSLGLIVVMYRQLHSRRQLKLIAETDSLTDLYNRRYALATGGRLVDEKNGEPQKVSIMMFDLDDFKSINDTYGHNAGDQVLKVISQVSKGCLRDSDTMARIGGEEFLAILPGVTIDTAQLIAERLKDKLAGQQHQFDDDSFAVTASFGVAMANGQESFEALMQRADKAMYLAKDNGRNCVEVT